MEHPYLAKIKYYLEQVGKSPDLMGPELIKAAQEAIGKAMARKFNEVRNPQFTIRLSNIGKPVCQLQMEQAGVDRVAPEYNHQMRMMFGDLVEALGVAIIKASGITVLGEQVEVSLDLDLGPYKSVQQNVVFINGTLDLLLPGLNGDIQEVWDVKSCSNYAFNNKFCDFSKLAESDGFGYIAQLFGYAKAIGARAGGWFVINKETGEWTVLATPEGVAYEAAEAKAMELIKENTRTIVEARPFQRCFEDEPEFFRKKPTGNRQLGKTCGFCDWRFTCWPGLEYAPTAHSEAKNPRWKYYTVLKTGGSKDEN